jgi:hypothetical protein
VPPGAPAEANIHHDDVGTCPVGFVDGLTPRAGLRAHQHILRGLEKRLHAASHDLVIIDE